MLKNIPAVRIKLEYLIENSNKEKLTEGYTIHSFVNFKTMKPTRPPLDFIELVKSKF
jgi:acyl-CoA thioesterase FadM